MIANKDHRRENQSDYQVPSPAVLDGWMRLGVSVLRQAAVEAQQGNRGALIWLQGDEAGTIAELAGFDAERIRRVASSWKRSGSKKIVVKLFVGAPCNNRLN